MVNTRKVGPLRLLCFRYGDDPDIRNPQRIPDWPTASIWILGQLLLLYSLKARTALLQQDCGLGTSKSLLSAEELGIGTLLVLAGNDTQSALAAAQR